MWIQYGCAVAVVAILWGWLIKMQRDKKTLDKEIVALKLEKNGLEVQLREKEKAYLEKSEIMGGAKEQLKETFKGFSYEMMMKFEERAANDLSKKEKSIEKILQPIKEGLNRLDGGMREIEKKREGEKEAFKEQMKSIIDSEKELKKETSNLVKALRKPEIRGMWGEMQLKRVIELSGMINHCDFFEQVTLSDEGTRMRPDVIIQLPDDKQVIIDAKAPFEAFLEANNVDDVHEKERQLKRHARHLREHIQKLSKKNYWQSMDKTPEFVVLFLPAEVFFSAALQYDPTLIEMGAKKGIILATPTTLIGLLKSVAYGWKQDTFSKHAKIISDLGHQLYKRLHDMHKHWTTLGKSLTQGVDAYNKAMGSLEKRVLVTARKFQEFGAANEDITIPEIEPIDISPKQIIHIEEN